MGSAKPQPIKSITHTIGLVGEQSSGKTGILERFIKNQFKLSYTHTEKNKGGIKSYILDQSPAPVSIEVWELQTFNVKVDTVIIVVDCRSPYSTILEQYSKWTEIAKHNDCSDIHIAISKVDKKKLSREYENRLKEDLNISTEKMLFLTSALNNENIDYMFKCIVSNFIRNMTRGNVQLMV